MFYRFSEDERDRGHTTDNLSWHEVLPDLGGKEVKSKDLGDALGDRSDLVAKNDPDHIPTMFFDEHNCDLFDNVHPIKWVDPANDQVSFFV